MPDSAETTLWTIWFDGMSAFLNAATKAEVSKAGADAVVAAAGADLVPVDWQPATRAAAARQQVRREVFMVRDWAGEGDTAKELPTIAMASTSQRGPEPSPSRGFGFCDGGGTGMALGA